MVYINPPKVSLLVAADMWRSRAIPSKGISNFKTTDGPNGARGAIFTGGTKVCTCRQKPQNPFKFRLGSVVSLRSISSSNLEHKTPVPSRTTSRG